MMNEDVSLPQHVEHRPIQIAKLGRSVRVERRIAKLGNFQRRNRHQIAELQNGPVLDDVRFGKWRNLRGLVLLQLFE